MALPKAKARSRTFTRRKFFYVSTPTIGGRSEIDLRFENSDQRFYQVPCPHCQHYQVLEFQHLKWDKDNPKSVRYQCTNCHEPIYNWQKTEMLKNGKWVATAESDIVGFHLNALYSPVGWYSWEEIVKDWLAAQKNTNKLKAFMNTVLGEPWKEKGDAPDHERLYERADRLNLKLDSIPRHTTSSGMLQSEGNGGAQENGSTEG